MARISAMRVFIKKYAHFPPGLGNGAVEARELFKEAKQQNVKGIYSKGAEDRFFKAYYNAGRAARSKEERPAGDGAGGPRKSAIRIFVEGNADFSIDGKADHGAVSAHLRGLLGKAQRMAKGESPELQGVTYPQISSAYYDIRRKCAKEQSAGSGLVGTAGGGGAGVPKILSLTTEKEREQDLVGAAVLPGTGTGLAGLPFDPATGEIRHPTDLTADGVAVSQRLSSVLAGYNQQEAELRAWLQIAEAKVSSLQATVSDLQKEVERLRPFEAKCLAAGAILCPDSPEGR